MPGRASFPARSFHASTGAICRKSIAATSEEEEEEEEEGAAAVSAQRLRTRRAEMRLAPLDSVEHFAHEML